MLTFLPHVAVIILQRFMGSHKDLWVVTYHQYLMKYVVHIPNHSYCLP